MSLNTGPNTRGRTTAFMEQDDGNVLFGPESRNEISPVIAIDDEPIIVRAHNLGEGERVLVEIVDGDGAGKYFSPYMRGGTQVRLTRKCNQIAIATPGRYRFILKGVVGIAYVRQFRASMTHEFLLSENQMSCCDEFPTTLPPSGPAGGDLNGAYPNPQVDPTKVAEKISANSNAQKLLAEALCEALTPCIEKKLPKPPTSLPPSGEANGDLQGNYPAPTIDPQKAVERIRLNQAALEALAKYLCEPMTPCIKAANPFDPDKIAAVFRRCDGSQHIPNNALPTCSEVDSKIVQAISSIPADKFLEIVGYDKKTHTLSFTVANGGKTYTVDLSDLLPIVVGLGLTGSGTLLEPVSINLKAGGGLIADTNGVAVSFSPSTAPIAQKGTELPTVMYGGRAALLGQPDGWFLVGEKRVPYWN